MSNQSNEELRVKLAESGRRAARLECELKEAKAVSDTNGVALMQALNQRDAWKACAEELGEAVGVAINTVECASYDIKTHEELPWYRMANKALSSLVKLQKGNE